MRRVVVAGAGLLLVASVGVAHAMTVPASSSQRWCAERSDVGAESPSANVSFVLGIGVQHEADTPNVFACWSNSANAEVVRVRADPDTVRAGAECVPMPGSRTRLRCPRQLLETPVDEGRQQVADARNGGLAAGADTTSDAVELDVSLHEACAAHGLASWCSGEGVRGRARVAHDAHVSTGEDECRMQPGRRCLVGGQRRDPAVEANPDADADIGTEDRSAEPSTVTAPQIPGNE